jgi:tRNA threonylcarbamoyladenosine biosynthesis protein TsaE
MEAVKLSCRQTVKLGQATAKKILKLKFKKAIVIGLQGELGSGKTTFLQGFAQGLGIKERVLSPTFIIFRRFEITVNNFSSFYHFDCYRLKGKKEELLEIEYQKIINDPRNIVAIEWADRIKSFLPKEAIWINFEVIAEKERKITLLNLK